MFRQDEIIAMIGAGCSADAGAHTSTDMVNALEVNFKNTKWKKYKELYDYVKSSILYADGIRGKFGHSLDIERLVNSLAELEKKDNCILYPFIGNWNVKLLELTSYRFEIINELREKIVEELKDWVTLKDYGKASYYTKLFEFQEAYNYPLRVFSLNYDLCLEKNIPAGKFLERGFDPESKAWDSRRFYPAHEEPNVYLYKLHGSLDWERDEGKGNIVIEVDNIPKMPDLIFGTDYKLTYVDPYLYYASEFRKYSLEAKVILVIGYSFNDEHINSILEQSLNYDSGKRLYVVNTSEGTISPRFGAKKNQIIFKKSQAKEFLEQQLSVEMFEENLKEN